MSKELMEQGDMPYKKYGIPEVLLPGREDGVAGSFISYGEFVAKLFKPFKELKDRLNHAIIGLAGEAGEITDEVKQLTIYEKGLNVDKLQIECSDAIFYIQAICNEFGWTLDDLCQVNAEKLAKRYHKMSYSNEQALDRADGEAKGAGNAE